MGRKSGSKKGASSEDLQGCFNAIWSNVEADDTPVARKSLSERKFSEGFEAPRNSLDIASAVLERQSSHGAAAQSEEIPFGYELGLRRPSRVMAPAGSGLGAGEPKCKSPSVIARLMGLDTLPSAERPLEKQRKKTEVPLSSSSSSTHAWNLMSERSDFSSDKQHYFTRQLSGRAQMVPQSAPLVPFSAPYLKHEAEAADELLLFDVLPFREQHPQQQQLQKLKQEFQSRKAHLEELRTEMVLKQLHSSLPRSRSSPAASRLPSSSAPPKDLSSPSSSSEILNAIHFLQSNKELLVKFLQEPDSVFAKHVFDLQALAAKESARSSSKAFTASNVGFSRKLGDCKSSDRRGETSPRISEQPPKHQQQQHSSSRIILLKPNMKKQSTCTAAALRTARSGTLQDDDPWQQQQQQQQKTLKSRSEAKEEVSRGEISRHVRERLVVQQEQQQLELSPRNRFTSDAYYEPPFSRYTAKEQTQQTSSSSSLQSSPRLKPNVHVVKEGKKQDKLRMTTADQRDEAATKVVIQIEVASSSSSSRSSSPQKKCKAQSTSSTESASGKKQHRGKLLKLFSKETTTEQASSSDSPRHLVRSKSASSLAEDRKQAEVLERTRSCRHEPSRKCSEATTSSGSSSKGKFSSLKSSLLGKKRSTSPSRVSEKSSSSSQLCKPGDVSVNAQELRDDLSEALSCASFRNSKMSVDDHSPRFITLEIEESLHPLDARSDVHAEKFEQPSPVSVLERAFLEESPSPVSFDDVTSDLQELQMRLQRLKLDEMSSSERNSTGSEELTPVQNLSCVTPSYAASPCSVITANLEDDADQLYIKRILDASGFSGSMQSLMNWHSPSSPLDPCLFAKLEEQYSDPQLPSHWQTGIKSHSSRTHRKLKIGRAGNEVQRRPESLYRQMLFDTLNEILESRFHHLWDDQPWLATATKRSIRATMPTGGYLLQEVCKQIASYQRECDSVEYLPENLVERDVMKSEEWMDVRDEMQRLAANLEGDILDRLVEEVAKQLMTR